MSTTVYSCGEDKETGEYTISIKTDDKKEYDRLMTAIWKSNQEHWKQLNEEAGRTKDDNPWRPYIPRTLEARCARLSDESLLELWNNVAEHGVRSAVMQELCKRGYSVRNGKWVKDDGAIYTLDGCYYTKDPDGLCWTGHKMPTETSKEDLE